MKRFSIAALLTLAVMATGPAKGATTSTPVVPDKDVTTRGVAHIAGTTIPYTSRAGNIVLRDNDGKETGYMFYTSFVKDGGGNRPVTFFYNGGPGSSTIWLRMGSFAPMRVQTANAGNIASAPYQLVDNTYSLLDLTDLVFVDAPGTGYSRIVTKNSDFAGVDQDGHAFTQFIKRYLTQTNRWNSPKFLFGESYGTTRSAVLAKMLQNADVQLNGIVLLSSVINYGLGFGGTNTASGDWSYYGYLPTEAAAAWYYHKAGVGMSLPAFLQRVEQFDNTTYLHDLAQGSELPKAQYDADVRTLHQLLGVSEEFIRNNDLRISYRRFQTELLRDRGMVVGRYDARFNTDVFDRYADTPDWDPSDTGIDGAFVGLGMAYMTQTLGYKTNLEYRPTAYGMLGKWDMKHDGQDPPVNTAPDLAYTLTVNPHLRVFAANGYYDFATPFYMTQYTLGHLGLAPQLQSHIRFGFYPSGHMVYLNPAALAQFKGDLTRWYSDVLSGR